jgi:hypothetical protein
MEDYICHYGRKNQKWGVRNGPPYPIEDKVLKAGTRLNSVSSVYRKSEPYVKNGRAIYTYRPDEAWDKKVYEGPFSMYLVRYRGAQYARVHEFETTEDMKMPTTKERKEKFEELLNDKWKGFILKNELKDVQSRLVKYHVGDEKEQEQYKKFDAKNIKTKEDLDTAYAIFNHAMETAYSYSSTRAYMKVMQKNYDAMVDDNNQGVYNDARDPIIVFNARKFLKDVSDQKAPRYLSMNEIINNSNEVRDELKKQGKGVKL